MVAVIEAVEPSVADHEHTSAAGPSFPYAMKTPAARREGQALRRRDRRQSGGNGSCPQPSPTSSRSAMMLASWRGRLHDESERVQQARPAAGWRRGGTGRSHGGVRRRRCVADHDTPSVEHVIVVVVDQLVVVVDVDDGASDDHDGTGDDGRAVDRRAEPGDRRPPGSHQGHRADAGRRRVRVHRHPRQCPVRGGPAGGDRPLRRRGRRRDVHPVGRRERDATGAARRRAQLRRPVDHRGSRHRPRRAQQRRPSTPAPASPSSAGRRRTRTPSTPRRAVRSSSPPAHVSASASAGSCSAAASATTRAGPASRATT